MTTVYKVRDPKTGEFYTGEMWKTSPTSKSGKLYTSISTVKGFLTRCRYDSRMSQLVNPADMEVVEFTITETATKGINSL